MEWLTVYLQQFTYVGIALVLFLAGLGIPIPEDIPLIFGGVMAGKGEIDVYVHFGISMVFILLGDVMLFLIGRKLGKATTTSPRMKKMLTMERREKVVAYFAKYGIWTVFFARFVAGIRGAVFLSAGAAGFPLPRFVLMDFLAAMVSVPVWIWLGYQAGENWHLLMEKAKATQGWILGGAVLLVVAAIVGFKVWRKRRAARAAAAAPTPPATES